MSNPIYECDTCRQQIEITVNDTDIQLLNKCIITQGCTGELHSTKTSNNPQSNVDYQSRSILYEHNQLLPSQVWTVAHFLNADPISYVYRSQVDSSGITTQVQVDPDEYETIYIDNNTTTIIFKDAVSGIVHSLARSSTAPSVAVAPSTKAFDQVTANSILTIGIRISESTPQTTDMRINFVSPSTGDINSADLKLYSHNHEGEIALFDTPWKEYNEIYLGGYPYKVQSVRINNVLASNNIEDGSPFFFDSDDFVILQSQTPYDSGVDARLDRYTSPKDLVSKSLSVSAKVSGSELAIEQVHTLYYHPNINIVKYTF